jgi:hypothetical protein
MKIETHISIWFNNEHINTIYLEGMGPAPFKKGDRLWFSVEDVHPRTRTEMGEKWKPDFIEYFLKDAEDKKKLLNNQYLKVSKVYRSVKWDPNNRGDFETTMTVTYEYTLKKAFRLISYWRHILWKARCVGKWLNEAPKPERRILKD